MHDCDKNTKELPECAQQPLGEYVTTQCVQMQKETYFVRATSRQQFMIYTYRDYHGF